jgi:dienelactone hydrolase
VPDAYNTVVTMEAYNDVAGSAKGPFPVVLFSHGASAFRMASSGIDAGIASWGFVVVSVDYVERGEVTQFPGQKPVSLDEERDRRLMLAGLDLVTGENDRSASVLHGLIDGTRVASAGHSVGGTTAFDALTDPRVKVAVLWAPAIPTTPPASKPTMIIGASNDIAVTPAILKKAYAALPVPKRWVEIGNAGHNSFTDLCLVTRAGGGSVKFAIDSHLIPPAAATILLNGCGETDLKSERFFPVVQHFTVTELRSVFGIDTQPVGLGDGITQAFPHIKVTYHHQP